MESSPEYRRVPRGTCPCWPQIRRLLALNL